MDSSALLALVVRWARRTGGTTFAVALDFEARGDDRPHLRALQASLGCEIIRVRPEDAAQRIEHVLAGVDGAPFSWPTGPAEVELMARARAAGAEVVLTGAGGDNLFDGEAQALAGLARRGHPVRALLDARQMLGFADVRARAFSWVLRPHLADLLPRHLRLLRARRRPRAVPEWAGPLYHAALASQEEPNARASLSPRRTPEQRFLAYTSSPIWTMVTWGQHLQEVASGLSRRDPYLDPTLTRSVLGLHPEWLVAGARRRGLLRDAMGRLLPTNLRERMTKSRFDPALRRFFFAADGPRRLAPFASGERLGALGLVEPRPFERAAHDFFADPQPRDWLRIWPALACEAFLASREQRAT